jgi:5-methyltetrahydropteroyltriglutamate--homocysteine methyltransferase
MISARADVVGSLLRPLELVAARADAEAGRISRAVFESVEDRAVDAAVALQEDAGLEVVSDGEMRRLSFQSQMTEAVDGFGAWDLDAFLWGDWRGDGAVGDARRGRPTGLGVTGRLVRRRYLSANEFAYLRDRTSRIPKIALPSPGLFANFWSPERSTGAYPTLEGFLADIVAILRDEVAELARLGARYIQIDAPHYPLLLDPRYRDFYEARGWTFEQWLSLGLALDNAVMDGFPDVTFGFHLCRGNQGSRWLVEGGYGPIAEPVFKGVRAERLLLEYDDARSGSFEPLRHVPDDRTVVLGLVTTKRGDLESADGLERRIAEASRHVPMERLAISPQCGFATSVVGNALSAEDQRRKLALVCEVARRVWG